ncbi:MAG: hypothetical protein J6U64_00305 [Alphaproteobacteria bacterium]|jgi:hypothetical protein|nr:hypothetical protein [Alphaproteobacteria bacterium]
MQKHYTEDDLKTVIGQVSSEISKITGAPKEEIYPFSELNQDIGMSISELAQLSISLEDRYKHSFSSLIEEPSFGNRKRFFYAAEDKQTVEGISRLILEINPDAAKLGERADIVLPQKKASQSLVFKFIEKQKTHQK